MSRENLEALRRVYEGWGRGDFRTSEPVLDENVTLVVRPGFPTEGVWVGLSGMREHMAQILDAWDSFAIAAESFREVGDTVLVAVHQTGTGAGSGAPAEMRYFQLWSFRAGKAIRLEVIADEPEALEAVGLSK
jgi:ketosteroid isomerase-like protein